MENLDQDILELIARHLKGETSLQEENHLDAWLRENDSNKKAYEELILIWNTDQNTKIPVPDLNKAWNKVKSETGVQDSEKKPLGKSRSLFQNPVFVRVAASVVLVIGILLLFKNIWSGKEHLTEIASGDFVKEVYLPDSTKVTLNKNSKIAYSDGFNEDKRLVQLEGEAFFEVKKDRSKPFIVLSTLSRTEVLGTAFNIVTPKGSKRDEIQVQRGIVAFASKNEKDTSEVILTAGERAVLYSDGKLEKAKMEDENFLGWKNGLFNFHNAKLEEIVSVLEKSYDVNIHLENAALKDCRFTGNFEKASIDEILQVMSVSINLSYKQQSKKSFLIKGEGCN